MTRDAEAEAEIDPLVLAALGPVLRQAGTAGWCAAPLLALRGAVAEGD